MRHAGWLYVTVNRLPVEIAHTRQVYDYMTEDGKLATGTCIGSKYVAQQRQMHRQLVLAAAVCHVARAALPRSGMLTARGLLSCRNADVAVLKQAVHASSLFSHTHELGRDGALVQAAAVAFLSRSGLLPVWPC